MARSRFTAMLCLLLGTAACDAGRSLPASARSTDGLLADSELQAVVELGVRRDMYGLLELMKAERPEVRARAAAALASLQAPESVDGLVAALGEEDPQVRRDAAFALGRIGDPATASVLSDALAGETDAVVRARLLEALGHMSTEQAADLLLAVDLESREEADRARALSVLGGVYGVRHEGLRDYLIENLTNEDPSVRLAAASFFSLGLGTRLWATHAIYLRQALDGYDLAEPAAMHLVMGLGRLRDFLDSERLRRWATEGEDWRTRGNAVTGLDPFTRSAQVLVDALDDPSPHVAFAAVRVLTGEALDEALVPPMELWIERNPGRLAVIRELMIQLAQMGRNDAILAWVDAIEAGDETRWEIALEVLSYMPGEEALTRIARAGLDPSDRTAQHASSALARRWALDRETPQGHEIYFALFRDLLEDPRPSVAAVARAGLESPEFAARGAELSGLASAPTPASGAQPGPQRAAALLQDPQSIDWEFLQGLGSGPSLVLETSKGTVSVQLLTEEAPLTVQTVAKLALAGHYDGVPFHRVLPNFMAQTGDIVARDGTGEPGFSIRTELTQLPFEAGVIGMANLGRLDSENSQFFITHSRQLHLDRGYTAFGWVERGLEVLELIEQGDAILSATVVPG